MIAVVVYLGAIVTANLLVARFGPSMAVWNALWLVGLDLALRDRLHDRWRGRNLMARMALLIATGGALSYILNPAALSIAVGSSVAFMAAAAADGAVYHLLRDRPWLVRSNGSSWAGAAVDSVVFPTIAFGAWLPATVYGLFIAKIVGSFLWSVALAIPVRPRHG